MPSAVPADATSRLPKARMIDPRGHRFGAGVSAVLLIAAFLTGTVWLVALVLLFSGWKGGQLVESRPEPRQSRLLPSFRPAPAPRRGLEPHGVPFVRDLELPRLLTSPAGLFMRRGEACASASKEGREAAIGRGERDGTDRELSVS